MIRPQPRVEQLIRRQTPKIGRQSKLRLDINENIAGWPEPVIRDVLSTITPGDLAAYPETHTLYASIARRHAVTAAHVLVANGSELVIRYVFEAFLGPDTELLILDPSFAMFEVYGRLYGADIVKVPFGPRLDTSVEAVLGRLSSRTRLVAIANPNNPTGTVFSTADLAAITRRAAAIDCLVLVDEAYFYFHSETMAPLVEEFDNLIVTRTFSKAFGLAGVRIGYALGAPAVMEIVHEELAWDYARAVAEGKAHLVAALRALDLVVVDSHANFILVDLGGDRERVIRELQDRVLLGTTVRLPFPNEYIKITVGPVGEMERLVSALRPALAHRAARAGRVQE
jgi:histidinol-phosphate aminotransferase